MKKSIVWVVLSVAVLSGCGKSVTDSSNGASGESTLGSAGTDGVVIKSRSSFPISTGSSSSSSNATQLGQSQSIPITVVNSPSSTMTLDLNALVIPAITSNMLNFGAIQISDLLDNNLRVCGSGGKQKCTKALIRIYTTGVAGAGLYNSQDGYGAPILAGQTQLTSVGLNVSGAAVMQSITIPSDRNVVRLSDFVNPKYTLNIDFSNAGTGSYSSTLVVEYALSN